MLALRLSSCVMALALLAFAGDALRADDFDHGAAVTRARYPFARDPAFHRYPYSYRYNFYRPRRYPFGTQYYDFAPRGSIAFGGYTGNLYNPNVYGYLHGSSLFGFEPYAFAPGAPPAYGPSPFAFSDPGPYPFGVSPTWSQGFGLYPNQTWGFMYGMPSGPGFYGPAIMIYDDWNNDLRYDDYGGYIGHGAFLQGW